MTWSAGKGRSLGHRGFVFLICSDLGRESVAMTVNGFDDGLFVSVVTDGSSRLHNAACQSGLCDDAPWPQRILQFVLIDRAVTIADQVQEQFKGLGLHGNSLVRHR